MEAAAEGMACCQVATGDTIWREIHARKLIPATGSHTEFSTGSEAGLSHVLKADLNADRFSFHRDEAALTRAERCDGKLLLVTNVDGLDAEAVVGRYKSLADIERGFRVLKRDIELAPVYHRLPQRIRAHAFICFLALLLYRVLRMRLKATGSLLSPKRALGLLKQIQRHRIKIGEHVHHGTTRLTPEQQDLFAALQLDPPPASAV